jgi:hypothetical protein
LLAIVKALKKWHTSLLGCHFEVYTDHCTLEYFQTQKDMSHRQMRWSMYLADFDFDIIYIRGEENSVADALSQLPICEPDPQHAACSLAYTRSPSHPSAYNVAGRTLAISADPSLLECIQAGYLVDEFCQQLEKGILAGSIEGA